MIASYIFSSFFNEIDIFLQFHSLALNYWPLCYMIFFTFVLLGYPECMFVKLTRVNLHFLTRCFFI
jgi:hypothetical protein